jgi:hypothetical protein
MQSQLADRQLWQLAQHDRQLTCKRVRFDLPSELDRDSRQGIFGDEIDRKWRFKRVFTRSCQVDGPCIGSVSSGICSSTVPTFAASGHFTGPEESSATSASLQARSPSLAESEMPAPSGSVTAAFSRSALARPCGSSV